MLKVPYLPRWVESENKASLSPAAAGAWAELGNIINFVLHFLLTYVSEPNKQLHRRKLFILKHVLSCKKLTK